MLKFKIDIKEGVVKYTETIVEYDKMGRIVNDSEQNECSAEEVYTKIWNNGNNWQFKIQLIISLLGLGILGQVSAMLGVPFFILLIYFAVRQGGSWKSYMEYILDEQAQGRVDALQNAYDTLNTSQSVFPEAGLMTIKNLETDIPIFGWIDGTDKDEIFMLPDVCLVNVKQTGFAPIPYNKMQIVYQDMDPHLTLDAKDSRIKGQTWRWANKDGSPDGRRRASENHRMYEVIRGFAWITDKSYSGDGDDGHFSAGLIVSSPSIGQQFVDNIKQIFGNKSSDSKLKASSKNPDVSLNPITPDNVSLDNSESGTESDGGDDFMTLSESVFILASTMGNADGNLDESEMEDVTNNNPIYLEHMQQIDFDVFKEKIGTGKCTKELAVSIIKKQTDKVQLDVMAIVWHVLVSDGVMSDEEKEIMAKLLAEFNLEIDDVNKRYEEMVS